VKQTKQYQSHEGLEQGMSDSQRKLDRLQIHSDLTGKTVLDIGCNEGFFCSVAVKRGADRVVGIDFSIPHLEIARRLYENDGIEFINSNWNTLPPGPFDLMLWTSAMHYECDPRSVFEQCHVRLAAGGLLIVECGVFDWPTKEMVPVQRHNDTRWYPTMPLLMEFLTGFSVRRVGWGEVAEGDPVPRSVFHCHRLITEVLLIRGSTKKGKTTLSDLIARSATKVISLDLLLARVAKGMFHHTKLQMHLRDRYDPRSLGPIYSGIDKGGLTEEYATFLAQGIARTDKLVVIEGPMTQAQVDALTTKLRSRAVVWAADRID